MENQGFDNEAFHSSEEKSLLNFARQQVFHADVLKVLSEEYCRIAIINYNIWIISKESPKMIVLHPDGEHLRTIKIHEPCLFTCSSILTTTFHPTMVTQTLKGDIVASCAGVHSQNLISFNSSTQKDIGLVKVTDKGQIEHVICQGYFKDVTHDSHCVYGLVGGKLLNTPYKIKVFYSNEAGHWIQMNDVDLESGYEYDRLMVRNSLVYLSIKDYDRSELHQYNQESTLIGVYGSGGNDTIPGRLRYCYLADQDSAGSLLVTDWFNDRLQVLDSDKNWYILHVINLVRPHDAVVHCDAGVLWIVGKDKQTDTPALFAYIA